MRPLNPAAPRAILVRGNNWVGDAVMSLPALEALGRTCPQARIEVLARPSVQAVYAASPRVGRIHLLRHSSDHKGLRGKLRLARQLKGQDYDWAVLWQNAFEAALIAFLARIPVRLGYAADGRGPLLTHPVPRPAAVRRIHETSYYLHILYGAGLLGELPPDGGVRPFLTPDAGDLAWAEEFLASKAPAGPILGLAPGAAYGPAKCWPAERFAAAAQELLTGDFAAAVIFGGPGEGATSARVAAHLAGFKAIDLAGKTTLGQALALLTRLGLFLTNDSGLMHAAAALGVPTLAVFGSTNPITTGPVGPWVEMVRRPVNCSPCLKPVCPLDLRCFTGISTEEVVEAARRLWLRFNQGPVR